MRKYEREKYRLKAYKDEKYMMEIIDDENRIGNSVYSDNWEELYARAKKEVANGKYCAIWNLLYEFSP